MTLTFDSDLENLFSFAHLHDEYICGKFHSTTQIQRLSRHAELLTDGQTTAGRTTEKRTPPPPIAGGGIKILN